MTSRKERAAPPDWAVRYDAGRFRPFGYAADAVLLSLAPVAEPRERLGVLLVERDEPPFEGYPAFPGGFVHWEGDHDALAAARRELMEETGARAPDYFETLDTYDAFGRDPRQFTVDAEGRPTGARIVSKAHLGLATEAGEGLRPGDDARGVEQASVYRFLPWEDQRPGEEATPGEGERARAAIVARLLRWAQGDGDRAARVYRAFGDDRPGEAGRWRVEWNEERAGERLRLLLEARLVEEACRTIWGEPEEGESLLPKESAGEPLAFDHRLILSDALSRVRGKIKYLPRTLRALTGPEPTLVELHWAVEAVSGRPVDRGNFWRIFTRSRAGSFLEATDRTRDLRELHKRGPRPAVYRYGDDVERLRLDPSIRYPWAGPS